jgi:hypothetical protein
MVGIVFSSGIRDVARFEAAKNILERYFAERQKPEIPVSFSPWGNNDGTFSHFLQMCLESSLIEATMMHSCRDQLDRFR